MTLTRIYLDTEFTSLNRYRAKLISLALVVPGGPEFYVELTDTWSPADCSPFVVDTVLPLLDHANHGRTTDQARAELLAFFQQFDRIEIISDAISWDWPFLIWLAGPRMPDGIENDQACIDREIELDEIGEPPHHALQDARLLVALVEPRHGQLDIS
ncbi:hypothetical protein [Pseudomonas aeruginosa]|uniref:hypothetical protein n=1 Tax=Pseudomonas aeruginosa TaxID=287 RepID=UPI0025B046E0|nr:hypothetical protein [Pseudomonas aeruginosa]MDN2540121.1 hypothetical protein [Pseudomonas aeruginosa]MDN2545438.1 hypothetical protein [Pseudomonas aeruginosa]MDN2551193.1 hypothetical protein [Pseudomonas aeruginosa]